MYYRVHGENCPPLLIFKFETQRSSRETPGRLELVPLQAKIRDVISFCLDSVLDKMTSVYWSMCILFTSFKTVILSIMFTH